MVSSLFYKKTRKAATPPGTLEFQGAHKTDQVRISVLDYDASKMNEREVASVEDCRLFRDSDTVSWINVNGLHDLNVLTTLGDDFGIHALTLEDILNTDQRPKLEELDHYLFIVMKMIYFNDETQRIEDEQISLIVSPKYVITFQEREGDVFSGVRNRIRNSKGRIRSMSSDYLAYALMDAIVDHYFSVLEVVGDQLESLEDEVMTSPATETRVRLHILKRRFLFLKKNVWPLRDVISLLEREESPFFKPMMKPFLRDLYDHTIQIMDMLETLREMTSGLYDMYLSSVSHRMNEVMKVLTIIATIFIPLTFIAGIYGMNFEFMPELKWKYAYFAVWGVMAVVALGMMRYFKKKEWL